MGKLPDDDDSYITDMKDSCLDSLFNAVFRTMNPGIFSITEIIQLHYQT